MGRLVEVVVESVRVHMLSNRHVIILKDAERDRYLPIWIGAWEASAIAMKLQGLSVERPITHDLFVAALEALGARIHHIVIAALADETYHARLVLDVGGKSVELDARPSDCVALAVRTQTQILVAEEVLELAGLGSDPDEGESAGSDVDLAGGRPRTSVDRDYRREVPIESLGEAVVDERLDMFRDFINSLEKGPGSG
ncbi:MAG: bifunctional nuclease family protein [Chloroflexi bacterium]|nr:bifunctional nuclease family protein [Chloroflexota bacterium]